MRGELLILPLALDRSASPHALGPNGAHDLQRVDLTFLRGRVRRGLGCSRISGITGASTIISAAFVARLRMGVRLVLDFGPSGTIRGTPEGTADWADEGNRDIFAGYPDSDPWKENFAEADH
jgi:hypothetical protein